MDNKNYVTFYRKRKKQKKLKKPYSRKSISKLAKFIRRDVLEIGVGDGVLFSQILKTSNNSITYCGVDIEKDFLLEASLQLKTENGKQIDKLCLINADFMNLPLKKKFDCIVSFEVIEHIKEPKLFLSKIHNLLHEGGVAIISTPNKFVYDLVATLVDGGRDPTHISEMTYREFLGLFSSFFKIEDSIFMLPLFPKLCSLIKSEKLWYFSEVIGKIVKPISLDVVLVGRKTHENTSFNL